LLLAETFSNNVLVIAIIYNIIIISSSSSSGGGGSSNSCISGSKGRGGDSVGSGYCLGYVLAVRIMDLQFR
jgi:hypothetical protein